MPGTMTSQANTASIASSTDNVLAAAVLAALKQSPAPVLAIDRESRVLSWNEAGVRTFGLTDDVRGMPLSDLIGVSGGDLKPLWAPADGPLELSAKTASGRAQLAFIAVPLGDPAPTGAVLALLVHPCQAGAKAESAPAGQSGVTTREREVLRLLASGKSTLAIAGELGIARTTARNHIQAILGKLEAHSRLEAVARARNLGLVG